MGMPWGPARESGGFNILPVLHQSVSSCWEVPSLWWNFLEERAGGIQKRPRRWTINLLCHDAWFLRGAELQVLWWAEDRLPGRAKESPAPLLGPKPRCHHLNMHRSEEGKDRKPCKDHISVPPRGSLSFSTY